MRQRYVNRTFLPEKPDDKTLANWLALERSFNSDVPICVGATGNPGTIPNAGTFVAVTWTQNANPLYDRYNMVGPTPTTNVRIPWDGFYEFFLHWFSNDNPAGPVNCDVIMEVAPTSDSGFGAPVFNLPFAGYRQSITFNAATTFDHGQINDFRGVELHANDLVRFRIREDGAISFTATTVVAQEFRFLYPIPAAVQ